MKNLFLISVLFAILIAVPAASFAENPTSCTFGDESTLLDNIFQKDFAVKAFTEKHTNVTRTMPADESDSLKNRLVLQAESDGIKETLELLFHTDTNGCYIPARYHYSYDNGIIDVTVRNSVANFTEIMNLINSDDLDIEDFYPDDCTFVDLDVSMSNGKSYGVCKAERAVTILIDASSDGYLKVDIPISMVYSLPSSNCIPTGDFFVMLDREETRYEITPTENGNLVTVEVPEGFHKITITGSVIIPNPSPAQYCGIVEGYMDRKYLAPLDQTDHGISPKSIKCNDDLVLVIKYTNSPACVKPETKEKLEQRGWTNHDDIDNMLSSKYTGFSDVEKLLVENNIDYLQDKLVVTSGISIRGDPGCGAVIDTSSETHWFGIDSISNPTKMILYSENPQQCVVNTRSCFCNAQMELESLTIDELIYFSPAEQEKYSEILIDYLYDQNINRTPKFQIGKLNIDYTDSSAIGYCGKIWGTNTYGFFDGAIINDVIEDYGISKERPLLCAISDDAKWWEQK